MSDEQERERKNDSGLRPWNVVGATVLVRYQYEQAAGDKPPKPALGRARGLVTEVSGETLSVEVHKTATHTTLGRVVEVVELTSIPRKRQGVAEPTWRPISRKTPALDVSTSRHPALVALGGGAA